MHENLTGLLVCPRDHTPLEARGDSLTCAAGHSYPVVHGIPVLLLAEVEQTLWVAEKSLARASRNGGPGEEAGEGDELFLDTLGINDEERDVLRKAVQRPGKVDAVVRYMVAATSGNLYRGMEESLDSYPIPELRLPPAAGTFLDVGCNWGRWSVAAARKGYRVVGIDPSLGAVLAAQRVSRQLGLSCAYVVADARHLPFPDSSFDVAFSYSVLQHLSKENAVAAIQEITRAMRPGGCSLVQMPNAYGVRSLYHQARRRFRAPQGFDVRYWTPGELLAVFTRLIGPTELSVDGFFGLGIQSADFRLMPVQRRAVILASEALRAVSNRLPPLRRLADSLYLKSVKRSQVRAAC